MPIQFVMEKITHSAKETEKFASRFARKLSPGDTVALYGNLGVGKTTFIKGLARGLGYEREVYSPTFIFARTYNLNNQKSKIKRLHHIDLYRAENKKDLSSVGIEDFLEDSQAVIVIEWAEKMGNLVTHQAIKVKIDYFGDEKRKIKVV